MKKNLMRPWLTSDGVEIPTSQLKSICKSWDSQTWEKYLRWYETSCRELLIKPDIYHDMCEARTQTLLETFDQSTDQKNLRLCKKLIACLPSMEGKVLQHIFFNGRTVREIAASVGISKSHVHGLKNKAILSLRRGIQGDGLDTRHLMRGGDFSEEPKSIWDQPLAIKIREARVYDPKKYKEEIAQIKLASLRQAILELSTLQQRMVYLRFWCDFTFNEIARELFCGVNLVEQVLDVAVSKIKRTIIKIETGQEPGGGPSCA